MSSVRMCDNCGQIFPEGEEGSATGSITVMVRGEDGITRPQQRQHDQCALCTVTSPRTTRRELSNATD